MKSQAQTTDTRPTDPTTDTKKNVPEVSRREFVKLLGAAGVSAGMGYGTGSAAAATPATVSGSTGGRPLPGNRYNVLFILTDQEQFYPDLMGKGYWPGRDRLAKMGTTFSNCQICAAVCTPSRSVIYTGQHIQHTRMFDNTNFPWVQDMSFDIPTIGHMMREAGYYTTYKGKCHLHDELHVDVPKGEPIQLVGRKIMEDYGFSDYTGIGDIVGMDLGGYHTDHLVTATSQTWLRRYGQPLNQQGQPWFFALNLVNPHDVMFYNTDQPGADAVQGANRTLLNIHREPDDKVYEREWDVPLSASRKQPWDSPGRPAAHREYQRCRRFLLGKIPNEDARWKELQDYYLNCISDCDRSVELILDELDTLGMLSNTIVIFTSDHGELCGAHGMSGKGATAYREQNEVPFIVYHPDVAGGRTCPAVVSHVDIVPTILAMTGADKQLSPQVLNNLHGHDFSPVLRNPGEAREDAIRDGALYCFSMWSYMDSNWLGTIGKAIGAGEKLTPDNMPKPDINKRSAIRSVFDGRYKFSRYFNMRHHNRPTTMEDIFEVNDVELYDLETDPHEVNNLAADRKTNRELLLAMNDKLNAVIDREVGDDDGQFLPAIEGVNWAFDQFDP